MPDVLISGAGSLLAFVIAVMGIEAAMMILLALLEKEDLLIGNFLDKIFFRYRLKRSEKKRRLDYRLFFNNVKNGQVDSFEEKAKKVIK